MNEHSFVEGDYYYMILKHDNRLVISTWKYLGYLQSKCATKGVNCKYVFTFTRVPTSCNDGNTTTQTYTFDSCYDARNSMLDQGAMIMSLFAARSQIQFGIKRQILDISVDPICLFEELRFSGTPAELINKLNNQTKPFRLTLFPPISKIHIKHLARCELIRSVSLPYCDLPNESLRPLQELKDLELLNLSDSSITDTISELVIGMKQLRSILLGGTNVSDRVGLIFKLLPSLRFIDLSRTFISNAIGEWLCHTSDLSYLNVGQTAVDDSLIQELVTIQPLEQLYLCGTNVTDCSISSLGLLPRLHTLDLRFTTISDDSLCKLAAMASLRTLRLRGTTISFDGLRCFLQQRPDIRIEC